MKEMEPNVLLCIRTYVRSFVQYASKLRYGFLINKNIGIEETIEISSSDK